MHLYFLRHGKAEEWTIGMSDAERELTEQGVAEMLAAAAGIVRREIRVDAIYASPLPRALQTAKLVASAFGKAPDEIEIDPALISGHFTLGELQRILRGKRHGYQALFVGHEPDLSHLVEVLSGGSPVVMKKGALACVRADRIEPRGGEMQWLVTAKSLIADGEQR